MKILYEKREECSGCGACYSICPYDAIKLIEDEEGFVYPEIIDDRCKRCLLCKNTCPFNQNKKL